jgi:MFS superfamily sulfate permease-like transporter
MKKTAQYYKNMWLKHDLHAGLSVFVVALPICLGIALASGAPLYAGLLSGIIGGVLVGAISGSQLAVSGPAAGLTTLVAAAIISLGDYKIFLLALIIAGLFQVLLGVFKLGVIANYFPSSVINGMLAAIGIILISKQIPLALGYNQPNFWTTNFLNLFSSSNFIENFVNFKAEFTSGAILISILSISILVFYQQPMAKKLKIIPASLVVVILGIVLNMIFTNLSSSFYLKPTQLVNIPYNIFASVSFPDFSKLFTSIDIWKNGLIIGMVATLETLLCIEAIDKLDASNRITPVNRELIAQGIGNITCGLLGAIPITAVVVRGSANLDAGAKTKLSAITHGIFLLLAVLFIPFLLNKIPYASLAAILLITGFNLTKPQLYAKMWQLGLNQFLPFIITIFVILLTDLLIGVSIGLLFSIYFIVQNNFKAEYKITKTVIDGIETKYIKLNTNVTFLNKVRLKKVLDEVPEYSILHIDGSESKFIDYDILEILSEFYNKAHEKHIEFHTQGIERVKMSAFH